MSTDIGALPTEARRPSLLSRLLKRPGGLFGLIVVALLALTVLSAEWLAPYNFAQQEIANRLAGPSSTHWLGTDHLGRDIFSRLVYGTRIAAGASFPAVMGAIALGVSVGVLAGYVGGRVESAILMLTDAAQAFPAILLALALLALLGSSLTNVVLVVGLAFAPAYVRVARAQTLALKAQPFVEVARALGASEGRIILRHILPNLLPPLIVLFAMDLPAAITLEAGLSFLGLGVRPPTPSWGVVLAEGFQKIRTSPWPVIGASLALSLSTLGFTLLGETLRDVLDPQLTRAQRS